MYVRLRALVVFENSKRRSDNALTIIYLNVIFLEIKCRVLSYYFECLVSSILNNEIRFFS